jgi:serine/threonine protein kinase
MRVPEIIKKKGYDQKAEVWSVGVLFHEILFGEPPKALLYNSKNYLISSEVKTIFERNYSVPYSKEVGHFLDQCLQTHPQGRMTWQELENHPIFQLIMPQVTK